LYIFSISSTIGPLLKNAMPSMKVVVKRKMPPSVISQ